MNKDYNVLRAELWANAWCSVASAANCRDAQTCNNWADKAVAEFDKRFQKTIESDEQNKKEP